MRDAQKSSKRVLIGRKLLLSGHSPHWLKRGAAIIPPLGSTILPHHDADDDAATGSGGNQMDSVFQSWTHDEVIPGSGGSSGGYSSFAYDFPSLYSSYGPVYDAFEWVDDNEYVIQQSDEPATTVSRGELRRATPLARKASLRGFLSENSHSHEFQRETLRSLMIDGTLPRRETQFDSAYTHSSATRDSSSMDDSPQVPFSSDASKDPLYFSVFGPRDIAYRESFRVDIWAYLRQQRSEMLETALEQNEAEVAQHVQPFHIQRGTLITVAIEANDRVGVHGDDSKTFRWRGDVSGVSFELYRKQTNIWNSQEDQDEQEESELCIARVIAGTKVSLLYIRLHRTAQGRGRDAAAEFAILESNLEHASAQVQEIPSQDLEIIRPVGSGAFGDAMLAKWHNDPSRNEVVVKVLHRDMYRNSDAVAEFQHEAAVMHMLGKHPHVVELLGICSNFSSPGGADSTFSLVTEYLPNGSLQDVLGGASSHDGHNVHHKKTDEFTMLYDNSTSSGASSSFGLFSRTVMARDAAHGLANIHQGHFLHRDIAARNCLVDDHFRVKVCDFGLSRKLNPSGFMFDDDRQGFGPLKWMAPESILPPHLFSMQSDSYMFGVLMYEIFTGERPFPKLSTRDAIALIREGKHVPIPNGLPATHAKLMQRCFELHPLHRPSMDQIYSTLDGWILQDTKTHVVI